MPLPVVPEQVTATWLTQALQLRYPDVTVTHAALKTGCSAHPRSCVCAANMTPPAREAGLPATLIVKGGFEAHSPT